MHIVVGDLERRGSEAERERGHTIELHRGRVGGHRVDGAPSFSAAVEPLHPQATSLATGEA